MMLCGYQRWSGNPTSSPKPPGPSPSALIPASASRANASSRRRIGFEMSGSPPPPVSKRTQNGTDIRMSTSRARPSLRPLVPAPAGAVAIQRRSAPASAAAGPRERARRKTAPKSGASAQSQRRRSARVPARPIATSSPSPACRASQIGFSPRVASRSRNGK